MPGKDSHSSSEHGAWAPLASEVEALLLAHPAGLREQVLLSELRAKGYFDAPFFSEASAQTRLFREHFLLMHVLYTLRENAVEDGEFQFHIDPMHIQMVHRDDATERKLLQANPPPPALAAYYLDIHNLKAEDDESLGRMLDSFWRKFTQFQASGQEATEQAMMLLNVKAPLSRDRLRLAFRRSAAVLHPDRGGDAKAFIQVQEAYELLLSQLPRQ